MRVHFVYLSILFFLFVIFLFLLKHINVDKEIGGGLYDELKKNSYNFHQLYDIEMEQYNSDNNLVLDTVKLLKVNGEFVGISDFIGEKDKFIIRFNDIGCSSCIKYFKDNINDVISFIEELGAENVAIVLNTKDPRTLYIFQKQYGIPCDVLGVQLGNLSTVLEKEEAVVVYYFCTLSKRLVLEDCFINIQDSPERTDAYFDSIKRKYKILDDRTN